MLREVLKSESKHTFAYICVDYIISQQIRPKCILNINSKSSIHGIQNKEKPHGSIDGLGGEQGNAHGTNQKIYLPIGRTCDWEGVAFGTVILHFDFSCGNMGV